MIEPLVSCCMITGNRRIFGRQAMRYWLRQTYRNTELVIVDGGEVPLIETLHGDLGRLVGVTYERIDPGTNIGQRRNRAAEIARGDILMNWDDDDWYSADRVEKQARGLIDGALVTCTGFLYRYHIQEGVATKLDDPSRTPNTSGGTLAYWRRAWEAEPFQPVQIAEDERFLMGLRAKGLGPIVDLHDDTFSVIIKHPRNTTFRRDARTPMGEQGHTHKFRELVGEDVHFYDELRELLPRPIVNARFDGWQTSIPDPYAKEIR